MHVPMLLSTCGPAGILPDALCNLVGGIGNLGNLASDIAEAVQNPFRWFYHHTLGIPLPQSPSDPGYAACQQDWASAQCPKLIDSLRPDALPLQSEWPRLYSVFAVSGMFIAATACVMRVVRALFDERVGGMHLVVDAVVRLLVVSGLLLAPTPGHSLLLTLLTWMASSVSAIAGAAAGAIAHAFNTDRDLGGVVDSIAGIGFGVGGVGDFLVAIPVLLAAFGFLYMVGLGIIRVIQLVFAVATAPLFIGVAAYDVHNRFVQWWLELLTSALLLPLVLAICGSLTGAIALMFLGIHSGILPVGGNAIELEMRTIVACVAVLGGVWMTGKAVHGLAWRGFSHGGFTGAVTALSASVLAVPTLATNVGGMVRSGARLVGGGAGSVPVARSSRATMPWAGAVTAADRVRLAASLHDVVEPASVGRTDELDR